MSDNHTQVLAAQSAEVETSPVSEPAPAPAKAETERRLKLPSLPGRSSPSTAVWAGLLVVALGFGTILFSWIKVASTLDVGRQMPYVVSGAMSGLGLIVVGIAVADMAVRRQDRIERGHQTALMRNLLEELREVLQPDGGDRR